MKKTEKDPSVLLRIRNCIDHERYTISVHALERQNERRINLAAVLYVLKNGNEEKRKTSFDEKQNTWKYAIRGKTLRDNLDVRVIVAFSDENLLIITVMYVEGL